MKSLYKINYQKTWTRFRSKFTCLGIFSHSHFWTLASTVFPVATHQLPTCLLIPIHGHGAYEIIWRKKKVWLPLLSTCAREVQSLHIKILLQTFQKSSFWFILIYLCEMSSFLSNLTPSIGTTQLHWKSLCR